MNGTYQAPVVSTKEVYQLDEIPIPKGYDAYGFRPPEKGELYLSTMNAMRGGKDPSTAVSNFVMTALSNFVMPRIILKKKEPTIQSVYGTSAPRIPEGFSEQRFGVIREGQWFLNSVDLSATLCEDKVFGTGQPEDFRLALYKFADPKKFRVVRVLEYVGPESWIDTTMKANGVKGLQVVGSGQTIRELSIFKEEVK